MTTITASSYSPNCPAQPLNPLTGAQVGLLCQGKTYDISQKVKTIVQRHFGYQGTEEFRVHFTKQEMTFTLKNGDAAENRTLAFQNDHWMLSKNSAQAAAIDPNLDNEVTTLVRDILDNIGQASRENAPDPAPSAASVDGADRPAAAANNMDLAAIHARLAVLESQLRANPALEQSLHIQQEILREMGRLRAALERQPLINERVGQLEQKIKAQQAALQNNQRNLNAQGIYIERQEEQIRNLEAQLQTEDDKSRSKIASLQAQKRALEDSLAELRQLLQGLYLDRHAALAEATRANQAATLQTDAAQDEVAALLSSVIPAANGHIVENK